MDSKNGSFRRRLHHGKRVIFVSLSYDKKGDSKTTVWTKNFSCVFDSENEVDDSKVVVKTKNFLCVFEVWF